MEKSRLSVFISLAIFAGLNLLMVNSLVPQLLAKQALSWLIGVLLFIIGSQLSPKNLHRFRYPIFISSCLLLLLPLLSGTITRGSRRWLDLGITKIQPSEFVKPWLLLFLVNSRQPWLHLIPVVLIAVQPDMGSALSTLTLAIPMVIFRPKLLKLSLLLLLLFLALIPLLWKFSLHDYQRQRVINFLNPTNDPLGQGYHLIQSKIAIGSGGLLGRGYKQGTQGQLLFLPEKHTDFIFAALAEELGLAAVFILIGNYLFLLTQLLKKAFTSHHQSSYYYSLGIICLIWFQVIVNIGMNLGLLPITGIPLPFISVGGSSLISLLFSLGIIYSVL